MNIGVSFLKTSKQLHRNSILSQQRFYSRNVSSFACRGSSWSGIFLNARFESKSRFRAVTNHNINSTIVVLVHYCPLKHSWSLWIQLSHLYIDCCQTPRYSTVKISKSKDSSLKIHSAGYMEWRVPARSCSKSNSTFCSFLLASCPQYKIKPSF